MHFYARERTWLITHVSGRTAAHALFLIYESIFPISPDRPIGCLSKPRCWIQALTPASGALAGPQPIAPPRPLSCEDVIFLFLSPALPPPSLSLSSFSFLIPLSSPPPLLFSHRYVPLALKGIGLPLWTPPSHFRLPRRSLSSPLPSWDLSADAKCAAARVVFFQAGAGLQQPERSGDRRILKGGARRSSQFSQSVMTSQTHIVHRTNSSCGDGHNRREPSATQTTSIHKQ